MKRSNQTGFTIIELLLAMAFFSFVLVFFTYGFIQINRTFQRGATIKHVTETGRLVIEDIARNIRLSSYGNTTILSKDGGNSKNRLCLGSGIRYAWNEVDEATKESLIGGPEFNLVQMSEGGCSDEMRAEGQMNGGSVLPGARSMMDNDLVVQYLDFRRLDNGLKIDMIISTGEAALITGDGSDTATCDGFVANGSQYCDVVRFTTTVSFRSGT